MARVYVMLGFLRCTPPPQLEADWLVVGLGNPGEKHADTRHNVGYMALARLADTLVPVPGVKALAHVRDGVAYAQSTTYMNTTGEAVGPLAAQVGVTPERVIVIHDELDLPAGTVRLKFGGNENGHNGLKSITEHLGTRDYLRVRVGIGRPPKGVPVPDWVLGPVSEEVRAAATGDAVDAVRLLTSEGLQKAQNTIHAR